MRTSSLPVYIELEVRSPSYRPAISGFAQEIQLSSICLQQIECDLKPEMGFQLNHSGSVVPSDTTEHARWRCRQVKNLAEGLVLDLTIRKPEMGVVEEIEKLQTNSQSGLLPLG